MAVYSMPPSYAARVNDTHIVHSVGSFGVCPSHASAFSPIALLCVASHPLRRIATVYYFRRSMHDCTREASLGSSHRRMTSDGPVNMSRRMGGLWQELRGER